MKIVALTNLPNKLKTHILSFMISLSLLNLCFKERSNFLYHSHIIHLPVSVFVSADGSVNNLLSYMLGADGTKRRLVYLAGQSDKY